MIIECPACNSRYRIREDKLPADGGNIKCPNCAHVFFVARPGAAASGSHDVATTQTGPPASDSQSLAPSAESGAQAAASGEASKVKRWKLRNSVGLVYDFPDVEQLRRWLQARDTFEGLSVSSDGGASWSDVDEVEDLAGVEPTGRKPVAAMPSTANRSGSFQDAAARQASGGFSIATADDIRREAKARVDAARSQRNTQPIEDLTDSKRFELIKPPANEQEEKASRLLLVLALIILPVVAAVALHSAGVIDLSDYGILPATEAPTAPTAVAAEPEEAPAARPRVELTPEQTQTMLVSQASNAIARGDTQTAIDYLESAVAINDSARELHCQLAALYQEVQRTADAETARARCNGADAAQGSGEGSGAL